MPVDLTAAAAAWLVELGEVRRLSPNTQRAYGGDLELLRGFLVGLEHGGVVDVAKVDEAVLDRFSSWLRQRGSPRSTARRVASVTSFFDYCVRVGFMPTSPATNLSRPTVFAPVATRPVATSTLGSTLERPRGDDDESPPAPADLRDFAIVKLIETAGLRPREVVALNLADILELDLLRVVASKRRERRLGLDADTSRALRRWVFSGRPEVISAHSGDALFVGVRDGKRLVDAELRRRLRKLTNDAGAAVSASALRAGFARRLLDEGIRVDVVQGLLGHARAGTTRRFASGGVDG